MNNKILAIIVIILLVIGWTLYSWNIVGKYQGEKNKNDESEKEGSPIEEKNEMTNIVTRDEIDFPVGSEGDDDLAFSEEELIEAP